MQRLQAFWTTPQGKILKIANYAHEVEDGDTHLNWFLDELYHKRINDPVLYKLDREMVQRSDDGIEEYDYPKMMDAIIQGRYIRGLIERTATGWDLSLLSHRLPSRQKVRDLAFDLAQEYGLSTQTLGRVFIDADAPSRTAKEYLGKDLFEAERRVTWKGLLEAKLRGA